MEMKTSACFSALLIAFAHGTFAQTTERINSHGSDIVLTIWGTESSPKSTVVLVPGWASGPPDVLGIGSALSSRSEIAVVVVTPRGWYDSEGTASFSNGLEDVGAVFDWIRASDRSDLNSDNVSVGGHSWGGGIALSYAAIDPSVEKVFSIAGTDHGTFIRKYDADSSFAAQIRAYLESTAAPSGPLRFNVDGTLSELREGQDTFGLVENADKLKQASILIVGGWEDGSVTIDEYLLPLYRALKSAGAEHVQFETYHANHGFSDVSDQLHENLLAWLRN